MAEWAEKAPLAAVILLSAVCGLRVNDDFHKPPQDGGDFGSGGGSCRVKAIVRLARQDARLLHGLNCLLCPGRNACVVRKGHGFQGFRNCVAQLDSVVLHNDRHLLPVDVGIRGEGGVC